jgi:hypothetical protein
VELELPPVACGGVLGAALRWWEPEADNGDATTTPQIKLICLSLDLGGAALDLLLPGHRGGGKEEGILVGVVVDRSTKGCPGAFFPPRAQHTATELVVVIFGQQGDPSSTSGLDALRSICW